MTGDVRRGYLRDFHWPGLWLAGWVGLLALVAVGSLMPSDDLPSVSFDGLDKIEHFVGHAVLSVYAVMLFARLRTQAIAALGLIAFGIALELAQATLSVDRVGDSADVVANSVGVLAGLLLSATPAASWLQQLEARLR